MEHSCSVFDRHLACALQSFQMRFLIAKDGYRREYFIVVVVVVVAVAVAVVEVVVVVVVDLLPVAVIFVNRLFV